MKDKTLELIKDITVKEIYNVLDRLEKLYTERNNFVNDGTIKSRGTFGIICESIAILEERHDSLIKELRILKMDI